MWFSFWSSTCRTLTRAHRKCDSLTEMETIGDEDRDLSVYFCSFFFSSFVTLQIPCPHVHRLVSKASPHVSSLPPTDTKINTSLKPDTLCQKNNSIIKTSAEEFKHFGFTISHLLRKQNLLVFVEPPFIF